MTDGIDTSVAVHLTKVELATEALRSSGTLRLQVTGWSMLPSVWPGDTLIIERATTNAVSVGDIILFGRERRLFAHRVVQVTSDAHLLTRGDAMRSADPVVTDDEVLGRVSLIERKGSSFTPSRRIGVAGRFVAFLVRSSSFAARVIVSVRGGMQALQLRIS